MRLIPLVLIIPALTACGALPASGPTARQITETAQKPRSPFDVIALNTSIADTLASGEFGDLKAAFGGAGAAPDLRLGIGDTVVVTIFEAASGGLFSSEGGALGGATKSVNLPPQPVARNGTITVPYAGQVKAAGLTPVQVSSTIVAALKDKAIQPQVIVTATNSASTYVTVTGDLERSGRIPLNLGGDRLLDLVATSGGAKAHAYDTFIRVTRGSTARTTSLASVVNDPGQNIYLRPNDQIYVFAQPRTFTAFGATARSSIYPFETEKLTLAEAMGRAGGLNDNRANARGVFIFRYEKASLYSAIASGHRASVTRSGDVPVIYQLNLRDPTGYFVAQRFLMRDKDVIYISNAPSADLEKFLNLIGSGVGFARSTTAAGLAADNLAN